jgi:hypothetical protein
VGIGYLRDCVYRAPVVNINDLKVRTAAVIERVDVDTLQHREMELEYRLEIVRVTNVRVESV